MILKGLFVGVVSARIACTSMVLNAAPLPQSSLGQLPSSQGEIILDTRGSFPNVNIDAPEIAKAAFKGEVPTLRRLIVAGVDIEAPASSKRTPLILAAAAGQLDAVAVLLEAGAKINAQDDVGDTALHWAARRAEDKAALFLIGQHAKIDVQNKDGESPLILAAAVGSKAIIKALIDSGANRELSDKDGRTAKKWAEMNRHPEIIALLDQRR